jgi:hypothetical protein
MLFGPLSYWTNSYWGGVVSGIAGCLVFGALPRRNGWLVGLGLGLQLLTRPYECALLVIGLIGAWAVSRVKIDLRIAGKTILAALPAVVVTLAQNQAVTGSWTTLPYQLSRFQYGTPTTFTFQPNPIPHRELSQEEHDNYDAQTVVHGREARMDFVRRLANRARFLRFFFPPPLYVALAAFFLAIDDRRMMALLVAAVVPIAGTNLYPYFYPHYVAAIACVFLLMSVAGLEKISQWSKTAAVAVFLMAAAHFGFRYGVHLLADDEKVAMLLPYETSDFLNRGDPEARLPVLQRLAEAPGKQLVFVRFGPVHPLREWINNEANIDRSRVVWALDLGRSENEKLKQYYPDRTVWLLEPDDKPPRLQPYPNKPQIHFETP